MACRGSSPVPAAFSPDGDVPVDLFPIDVLALKWNAKYGDCGHRSVLGALTGPSELEDGAFFAGWTLPDGTYVGITDSFDDIELAYLDSPTIGAQAE